MAAEVRFKDFTLSRPPIRFKIGDDEFEATPALSISLLQQVTNLTGDFTEGGESDNVGLAKKLQSLVDICDAILAPESATRFREIADKLDIREQVIPLLFWLLEAYGLRPTEVSSPSSASSLTETDGTILEDGASAKVSTSTDLLQMPS
jgi:hypothetical protein